jgi:outer membrane protein assembly factor BamB
MQMQWAIVCFTASGLACTTGVADDWPQFLGPDRNGICAETDLIDAFLDDDPSIVWRAAAGVGMSGVAVSAGSVYTLYQDDQQQYVVALDEGTGDQKWRTGIADAYQNSMGNGPRATPTVAGATVFVFTGEGILAALSVETGKVQWKVDTARDLEAKPADYGMSSSPLVVGGKVVVHVGSRNGTVVAYDVESGDRVWNAGNQPSGYSSPVMMNFGGTKQIVSFIGAAVVGIAPADGLELWNHAFETEYGCNIAVPRQLNDSSLLISSGENHGSAILKVTASGDTWLVEEAWTSFGKGSVLRSEWQTPVETNGYLFGMDNIGSAGPITNLVCVNIASGKQVWIKKRFGKSNLTLADGKLFISTMNGELVIVKAVEGGFQETARATVLGMTRQAPVIANGQLYLRDDNEVVCIDIRSTK